jgi:hypothetical protein
VLKDTLEAFKKNPALAFGPPPAVQILGEPATGEGVTREYGFLIHRDDTCLISLASTNSNYALPVTAEKENGYSFFCKVEKDRKSGKAVIWRMLLFPFLTKSYFFIF